MTRHPLDMRGALAVLSLVGVFGFAFFTSARFGGAGDVPPWMAGLVTVIVQFYFLDKREERQRNGNGHAAAAPATTRKVDDISGPPAREGSSSS